MAETKSENIEDIGTVIHSWVFPEFERHERGKNWYIAAAIIVGALLIYCTVTSNVLFAVIVIVAYLLTLMFHRSSNDVEIKITESGIAINSRFYDYKQLKQFYIIYEPPEVKKLYFEPRSIVSPRIPVALIDQDPIAIRETLNRFLTEDLDREHEPTSDQFSRLLKL